MGEFFIYAVKCGFCLIAFYLFYKLCLSRDTFHAFNRKAILLLMGLALVVPLIHVTLHPGSPVSPMILNVDSLAATVQPVSAGPAPGLSPIQWLFAIYLSGIILFAVSFIGSLFRLRTLLDSGRRVKGEGKEKIIVIDRDIAPFSWFYYIVLSREDYEQNAREILAHERAHLSLHHSADIAWCNLMIVFQWYNPAAWLLRRELQNVHEYEADEAVLRKGVDARSYQLLLIRKAVGNERFMMANNLNHSSLKKRITMMKMQKSNSWNRAKLLLALPLTAVAVVAFANEKVESMGEQIARDSEELVAVSQQRVADMMAPQVKKTVKKAKADTTKITQTLIVEQQKTQLGDWVEMAHFPGGTDKLIDYLSANIKYPATAEKDNVSGRVIVTFRVEKDGTLSDAKVVKGIREDLDNEALRIVGNMPKWVPGKDKEGHAVVSVYSLPITFAFHTEAHGEGKSATPYLDAYKEAKGTETGDAKSRTRVSKSSDHFNEKDLMILVDGKRVKSMKDIDKDKIGNLTLLKDSEVLKKYREKYGDTDIKAVLLVTLKK